MITTWVVTGDCHGDMSRFINYSYPRDGTTGIIILGDAGVNYYLNKRDYSAKKKLQNSGYQFYLVRGNHEARPEDCEGITFDYDDNVNGIIGYDTLFPAIHYFNDGNSYDINGFHVLVLGGAYSVDKYYRLAKGYPYQWFENEQLSKQEQENILNNIKGHSYDFVFSHTCPRTWEPFDLFLNGINQSQVDKTTEDWLDEIKTNIEYKIWLFGHFHADRLERPKVEQFYLRDDTLDNIWIRQHNSTILKECEIEKSPLYNFI